MKRVFLFCCVVGLAGACQHEKVQSQDGSQPPVTEVPSSRTMKEGIGEIEQDKGAVREMMLAYHTIGNEAADLVASLEKASAAQRKSIENYDAFAARLKAVEEKARTGASGVRSILEDIELVQQELESGRLTGDVVHNMLTAKQSFLQEYRSVLPRLQPELDRIRGTIKDAGITVISVAHDSLPGKLPE